MLNSKNATLLKAFPKPCPFCGGETNIKANATTLNAYAECEVCQVIMKRNFKAHPRIAELLEEMMIEAWNRRAKDENT